MAKLIHVFSLLKMSVAVVCALFSTPKASEIKLYKKRGLNQRLLDMKAFVLDHLRHVQEVSVAHISYVNQ